MIEASCHSHALTHHMQSIFFSLFGPRNEVEIYGLHSLNLINTKTHSILICKHSRQRTTRTGSQDYKLLQIFDIFPWSLLYVLFCCFDLLKLLQFLSILHQTFRSSSQGLLLQSTLTIDQGMGSEGSPMLKFTAAFDLFHTKMNHNRRKNKIHAIPESRETHNTFTTHYSCDFILFSIFADHFDTQSRSNAANPTHIPRIYTFLVLGHQIMVECSWPSSKSSREI